MMNKKIIILLVIAASLLLIGCIIFGGIMMGLNWDFKKLTTVKYETNEYEIQDAIQNIDIVTDTADIVFVPAEEILVVCTEQENAKHTVSVKDGTLQIRINDQTKWYERIGFNFEKPKITVYMPQGMYGNLSIQGSTGNVEILQPYQFDKVNISVSTGVVTCKKLCSGELKINTSTGDIRIADMQAGAVSLKVTTGRIKASDMLCSGDLNIHVSTGKTTMTNISCNNLISTGNTGDITLQNVVATETFGIERSTGDVTFEDCDAAQIRVKTHTGSVRGTLLTEKVFICRSNTGRVDVPKTISGGSCEITTDTGDIRIEIADK